MGSLRSHGVRGARSCEHHWPWGKRLHDDSTGAALVLEASALTRNPLQTVRLKRSDQQSSIAEKSTRSNGYGGEIGAERRNFRL